MAKPAKSGLKGKAAAKARLTAKAMKGIKGGDTKAKTTKLTTTTTSKGAFEIQDYGFDIEQTLN
jgi:hypothetical protein